MDRAADLGDAEVGELDVAVAQALERDRAAARRLARAEDLRHAADADPSLDLVTRARGRAGHACSLGDLRDVVTTRARDLTPSFGSAHRDQRELRGQAGG